MSAEYQWRNSGFFQGGMVVLRTSIDNHYLMANIVYRTINLIHYIEHSHETDIYYISVAVYRIVLLLINGNKVHTMFNNNNEKESRYLKLLIILIIVA